MSNKIDSISHQVPVTRQENRSGAADTDSPAAARPGAGEPAGGDTVELTGMARRLTDLEAAVADLPEVDAERVAALREQIASGEYSVDSRSVADKMLGMDKILPDGER